MSIPGPTSELKQVLRFPLQDRESRSRFALGCVVFAAGYLVPLVPGLIVYGYALRILQRTTEGEPPSMPAWDDWTGLLSLGFRGAVVHFVFTFPALVVFLVGFVVYFGALIPFSIASSSEVAVSDSSILLAFASMLVLFLSMFFGSVLLVLGLLPLPASVSHFAARDRLSAAFHIREWWPIVMADKLGYFAAFVVVSGILALAYWAFMILYSTVILLCLGFLVIVPTAVYAMLVGAALFGEAYRGGTDTLRMRSEAAPEAASA
jgi:hypothetical protein